MWLNNREGKFPFNNRGFAGDAGDEGEGKGDGDEGKGKGAEDTVAKADFDKVVADGEKTKQDLEDMRLEVLSPDYLSYLDTKDKKEEVPAKTAEELKAEGDAFEKLSKKEVYEKAKTDALGEFNKSRQTEKDTATQKQKDDTAVEVKSFAAEHEDYGTYRPVMYGLSMDPKYKNASLDKLYNAAKDYVKGIHKEPTEDEKKQQEALKGLKPGGDSESVERLTKLTADEATAEAVAEVKDKLGPIPSA